MPLNNNNDNAGATNAPSTKGLLIAILSTIALADFGLGLNTVVLPLYAKSLGASIITIGLIIAAFGLARILVNIPVSIISKKLKSQYIHIGMLFIFLGAVGYLLSTAYYQLFIFRFLEGFGSGIINTSSMIILTKHLYMDEKRGKVLSRYMIARRLSMGSAPFLGAAVALEFTDKAAFLLYSLIMLAGLVIAFHNKKFLNNIQLGHPETFEKEKEKTDKNAAAIKLSEINENGFARSEAGQPKDKNNHDDKKLNNISAQASPEIEKQGAIKRHLLLLRNTSFIVLCFLTFSFFFSRIGTRRELAPLVGAYTMGLNKADIGLLISISAIIGVILTYYSDRVINAMGIKESIIASLAISAIGILSFIIFNNVIAFGASIILLNAGGGFSGPARNLYLMDSVDKTRYDEAIGIYRTLSDFGFVLGPFAVGAVFEYFNYLSAYSLVAVIIILALMLFAIFGNSFKIKSAL
ncbi:MAG: MFS transporter [Deltaproteobacteria bacterium]|jgi:MFS family permease|nr:MFS transporter [Deltaproteobacteria bacterium]MCL5880324.1 MFS transporter [Deltaproteobacteria bacterium]MDA8303942.1 MFS transporter [Deltaproteobacteria bacterium]